MYLATPPLLVWSEGEVQVTHHANGSTTQPGVKDFVLSSRQYALDWSAAKWNHCRRLRTESTWQGALRKAALEEDRWPGITVECESVDQGKEG